jgi:hypothetical protein
MAEEHKKKKRKPRKIITTRHDDGTYSHEHMHDDGKHSLFAGTSQNVEDVQQHMADNFGGGAAEPEPAAAEAAPAAGEPGE